MSETMTSCFGLGGLVVASEFDLRVLPRLSTPDARADVTIRAGAVPQTLDDATQRSVLMDGRGSDTLLIRIPTVARFLVQGGCQVVVDVLADASEQDVTAHLVGTVQTALWYQRGLVPLHASVVEIDGKALALAGPSAAGKSTLAAALAQRGHAILADDGCIIRLDKGGPVVLPTVGMLRLWPDSARMLGYDPDVLPRALGLREKYLVGALVPSQSPVPLAGVLVLGIDNRVEGSQVSRLAGNAAHLALVGVLQRQRMARSLGLHPRCFQDLISVVTSASVGQLWRSDASAGLEKLVALVEFSVRGG